MPSHSDHDDFGGLHRDLHRLIGRRRALQVVGGFTLGDLAVACSEESPEAGDGTQAPPTAAPSETGSDSSESGSSSSASGGGAADGSTNSTLAADLEATAGSPIANETAGPFPADGTNGPNLLETSGVVR